MEKNKKTPVVLITGFLGTRSTMIPIKLRLESDGFPVHIYSYELFQISKIDVIANDFSNYCSQLCLIYGYKKLNIVAYSMGGLIAINSLKNNNLYNKIITLGTPFNGSIFANFGSIFLKKHLPVLEQMKINSKFLKNLDSYIYNNKLNLLQIDAKNDLIVNTKKMKKITDNYQIIDGGHISLALLSKTYQYIYEFLNK